MSNNALMQGFPPAEGSQVTLGNWRKPPFNRWSFRSVRELIPSAEIENDPADVWTLTSDPADLSHSELEANGTTLSLADLLRQTDTEAFVVLRKGKLIHQFYAEGMRPTTQHILMSVSKSVLGLVAGIFVERGVLDPGTLVTSLIPEVSGSAYDGATVRDLLDMRVGVFFDENYLATSGPIIEYRKAQNWDPLQPGDAPSDLRSFFVRLSERDGSHADKFHYVSPNTDLLGWVIERAAGHRYADLVSELLWRPLGAERSAYITVDRLGAPRCAGGMCTTARDLARLGQLIAGGGRRGDRQIVPESWINDILKADNAEAWNAGDFLKYFPSLPIHYRSKWYVLRGETPLMFAVGVFGQNLFVDRKNDIVIAKFSSQALPMDEDRIFLTIQAIDSLRRQLAEIA